MDATSPKGIAAIENGRAGLRLMGRTFVETPQDREASIDGFFLDSTNVFLEACFEVKARDITHSQLYGEYGGEWLLSADKVTKGAALARALCIPYYGILYLVPNMVTLSIRITDSRGRIVAPIRYEETVTQATCNGGIARRNNAFIQMRNAKLWQRIDQGGGNGQ